MKKKKTNIIIVVIFLIGLVVLLYPSISNWWNLSRQSRVISDYVSAVNDLPAEDREAMLYEAEKYNKTLLSKGDRYEMNGFEKDEYSNLLNIDGNGTMGYLEIPKISVSMPIYHTTDSDVLQFAAGHIPGTSLPVGGVGTHCVLSGHRGLPSARLFTDLDRLQTGDVFRVNVLGKSLCYEADQIRIVDPDNIEALEIDPEADLFTLVTCTPYGVNTHRLLVRGHRVSEDFTEGEVYFPSEAIRVEPIIVAIVVFVLILLPIPVILRVRDKRR